MSARRTAIWKDIPGYEGLYQASDQGEIRSLPRVIHNKGLKGKGWKGDLRSYTFPGRILKPCLLPNGYLRVILCKGAEHKGFYVHHLVLNAFSGPRPSSTECCHGNGDKTDNHLGNLRWDTRDENMQDRI